MSDNNIEMGKTLYGIGDDETKEWFHKSWAVWPKRVNSRLTTNGSLHYGGLLQYRIENDGKNPEEMSNDFKIHVEIMDKYNQESPSS